LAERFFEAQPLGVHEIPNCPVIDFRPATGKFGLKAAQGDMLAAVEPLQKPGSMRPQKRGTRPAESRAGSRAPRHSITLRPLHDTRHAHLENSRYRTNALAGKNTPNSPLAKIKGIGLRHQMLTSNPASILNHIPARNGIQKRFNPTSFRSNLK
jgi:hypothetical protein